MPHADELQHALHLSRPRIVFATNATLERVCQAAARSPFVQQIVTLDEGANPSLSGGQPKITLLRRFLAGRTTEATSFQCARVDMRQNVMLILCSSGTTGLPKGVQLTQYNLHAAVSGVAESLAHMAALGLAEEGVTTLSVIPWFHAYGLLTLIGMSIGGARLVTMARYADRAFLEALARYRCDAMFGVPPLLLVLAKHPAVREFDLSALKIVYSGAAPLSAEVAAEVQRRVPSVLGVFQGFGMSEMTLSVLQQTPAACSAGSVGVLRPGMWGECAR